MWFHDAYELRVVHGRPQARGRRAHNRKYEAKALLQPGSGVPSPMVGASVRASRLHGSATAIVDYVAAQTLPDTGVERGADSVVSYYDNGLSRWEPVGHWRGRQAEGEGLDEVRRVELARMVCGLDPNSGEPLGFLPRQGAIVAWDLTFTVPKSISAVWALSSDATRQQVVDAVDVAAAVAVELVDLDGSQTRIGPRDAVQVVDGVGLRAAQFRQVTSRAGDPHLHVHTLIGTKVRAPDGSWHALDARWLVRHQQAVGRVFDHELARELQRRLGVQMDWSRGHPEIAGVPDALLKAWSQRATQIGAELDRAVAAFQRAQGRPPTGLERAEIEQAAWQSSRTGKAELPPLAELERQWRTEARSVGVEVPLPLAPDRRSRRSDDDALVREAQTRLEADRSTWTRMEAIDAVARTGAASGTALTLEHMDRLVDEMAAAWIETPSVATVASPRRADGSSTAWSAAAGRFTSERVLADEATITAVALDAHAMRPLPSDSMPVDGLDASQAEAARLLAGTSRLPIVVGAAGTAKTTLVARAVADVVDQGERVLLLAPTRVAAGQLAAKTGARPPDERAPVTVDTIAGYLTRLSHQPDRVGRFGLVVVDEAGMVATRDLAQLLEAGESRGHRTALVGDWAQLGPVGRGGMFARLVRHHGDGHLVELTAVHRFAALWEQHASLRLRLGERAVLGEYRDHGRLRSGTVAEAAEFAAQHWLSGDELLVTCPTNDTARAVAGHVQGRLRQVGLVDQSRTVTLAGGDSAGAGDHVVTRLNLRQRTDRGVLIANRHRWTVDAVHGDGSITVTGEHGHARLDGNYVADHVELGYAGTVHAGQGATVSHALVLVDDHATHQAMYVGATRGRHSNTMWAVTQPGEQLTSGQVVERLADALQRDRRDTPVLDHAAALITADQHLARRLLRAEWTRTVAGMFRQPHYPYRLARWAAVERVDPADVLDALGVAGANLGHHAAYRLAAMGFGAAAVHAFATHHPHLDPATTQQAFLVGWRDAGGTLADWAAVSTALTIADSHADRRRGLHGQIADLEHRIERLGPDAAADTPLGIARRQVAVVATAHAQARRRLDQAGIGRRRLAERWLERTGAALDDANSRYETAIDHAARPHRRQLYQLRRELDAMPDAPPRPPTPNATDRRLAEMNRLDFERHGRDTARRRDLGLER